MISGTPLLDICVWAVLRCQTHSPGLAAAEGLTSPDTYPEEGEVGDMHQIYECPFFAEIQKIDHIVYNIPVFVLLTCNVFFLIWIMIVSIANAWDVMFTYKLFPLQIVVTKLRQRIALDHDRRNLKAAKVILIIIPKSGLK